MRSSRGLVLGLMALSLGLGITAALVHHFLYDSLDGKRTKGSNEQQWYVRIGTGLAFITKTLFTAAMTMAYAQILWFTLKSRSTTLKGLDSMFGVVHDVFLLRDAELWAKRPVLGLVALVIW